MSPDENPNSLSLTKKNGMTSKKWKYIGRRMKKSTRSITPYSALSLNVSSRDITRVKCNERLKEKQVAQKNYITENQTEAVRFLSGGVCLVFVQS